MCATRRLVYTYDTMLLVSFGRKKKRKRSADRVELSCFALLCFALLLVELAKNKRLEGGE